MTSNISFDILDLSKNFNRKLIFRDLNFKFASPSLTIITGKNGSGKSTLLKIINCLLSPTKGKIILTVDNTIIKKEDYYKYIGYLSPYLIFYDEFTLLENLFITLKIRGLKIDKDLINKQIQAVGLYERRNDYLKEFSSGMKQRVKYLFINLHNPPILCLDEPTANLDDEGKIFTYNFINENSKNKIVIVATNEHNELELSKNIINLDEHKR